MGLRDKLKMSGYKRIVGQNPDGSNIYSGVSRRKLWADRQSYKKQMQRHETYRQKEQGYAGRKKKKSLSHRLLFGKKR